MIALFLLGLNSSWAVSQSIGPAGSQVCVVTFVGMSRFTQYVYRSCDGGKTETFTFRESPLLTEEISRQLAELSRAGLAKISCAINPVSDRFEYICTAVR